MCELRMKQKCVCKANNLNFQTCSDVDDSVQSSPVQSSPAPQPQSSVDVEFPLLLSSAVAVYLIQCSAVAVYLIQCSAVAVYLIQCTAVAVYLIQCSAVADYLIQCSVDAVYLIQCSAVAVNLIECSVDDVCKILGSVDDVYFFSSDIFIDAISTVSILFQKFYRQIHRWNYIRYIEYLRYWSEWFGSLFCKCSK